MMPILKTARRLPALALALLVPAAGLAEITPLPPLLRGPQAEAALAERLDTLFATLAAPEAENWEAAQNEITAIWSQSGSPTSDLLLRRGRDAMNEGDLVRAISHLTRLVTLDPDFAEGWNTRATAYFLDEQYGRSLADIRQTLAREPRHFGALWGLGLIFERTDREDLALRAFRAAVAVNPHIPEGAETIEKLDRKLFGDDI